jgi:hypothetical protein
LTNPKICGKITTEAKKGRFGMTNVEKKRNQLRDTAFKLVYKHPYSMVRTKIDRISRQLRELDNKFVKTADSDK